MRDLWGTSSPEAEEKCQNTVQILTLMVAYLTYVQDGAIHMPPVRQESEGWLKLGACATPLVPA